MNFLKTHTSKIFIDVCVITVLTLAFFMGNEPQTNKNSALVAVSTATSAPKETPMQTFISQTPAPTALPTHSHAPTSTPTQEKVIEYYEEVEIYEEAEPVQAGHTDIPSTAPSEKEDTENKNLSCTLSVRCDNAIGKSPEKESIIPKDGIIFAEQAVVFYEGESVFDVLLREMKKNKIHFEFVHTPIYDSTYIEGIGNLYEFDCGEGSGWTYKVNGTLPGFGCSNYKLKQGDKVEIVYTCDLGKDVGRADISQ